MSFATTGPRVQSPHSPLLEFLTLGCYFACQPCFMPRPILFWFFSVCIVTCEPQVLSQTCCRDEHRSDSCSSFSPGHLNTEETILELACHFRSFFSSTWQLWFLDRFAVLHVRTH